MRYKDLVMNLYGMEGGNLEDEIQKGVIAFAKKHGAIPDVVLLHPKRMPDFAAFEVEDEATGEKHLVKLVADPGQLLGCFTVGKEPTALVCKTQTASVGKDPTTPAAVGKEESEDGAR